MRLTSRGSVWPGWCVRCHSCARAHTQTHGRCGAESGAVLQTRVAATRLMAECAVDMQREGCSVAAASSVLFELGLCRWAAGRPVAEVAAALSR